MISKLLSVSILALLLVAVASSTHVQAKPKTYNCESYKTTDGQWRYRISPSLEGSFINRSLYFIPVSTEKCKYNDNLGYGWRGCENCKTSPADPFNFCVGEGYGEIVEAPSGVRYRAFRKGTTTVLD